MGTVFAGGLRLFQSPRHHWYVFTSNPGDCVRRVFYTRFSHADVIGVSSRRVTVNKNHAVRHCGRIGSLVYYVQA
jgi:hypothetical protein